MADTVADFVVSHLADWGVKRVFAYPGNGINSLTLALGGDIGGANVFVYGIRVLKAEDTPPGEFTPYGVAKEKAPRGVPAPGREPSPAPDDRRPDA